MKRYKGLSYLVFLWALLLASCYEDKGNYDYDWVETVVTRAGIRDTTIERGTRLTMVPELYKIVDKEMGMATAINPEDYDFSWIAIGETTRKKDTLSLEKDLDTLIFLGTSESYWVNYTVTDKKSGVTWLNKFNLKVVKRLTNGLLFMTEDDDKKVELEIYATDAKGQKVHEVGVLKRSGFPYSGRGANTVAFISQTGGAKYLWVATGEATGWLALPDFTWDEKQLVRMKMATAESENYTMKVIQQFSAGGTFMVSAEGNAHFHNTLDIIYPDFTYVNKQPFTAAPYVGGREIAAILFDEDRKCFVVSGNSRSAAASSCSDVAANVAFKGSTLLHMSRAKGDRTVAILKDKDGVYRKCIFTVSGRDANVKLDLEGETQVLGGSITLAEKADSKVIDWNNSKFYFLQGGKVYNYRDGGGIEDCREVNIMQDGQKINLDGVVAVMNIPNSMTASGYLNKIFISTWSPEQKGTVYVTEPEAAESMNLVVTEVIPVEGKVKSVCRWAN